jgi:hypothetical protein
MTTQLTRLSRPRHAPAQSSEVGREGRGAMSTRHGRLPVVRLSSSHHEKIRAQARPSCYRSRDKLIGGGSQMHRGRFGCGSRAWESCSRGRPFRPRHRGQLGMRRPTGTPEPPPDCDQFVTTRDGPRSSRVRGAPMEKGQPPSISRSKAEWLADGICVTRNTRAGSTLPTQAAMANHAELRRARKRPACPPFFDPASAVRPMGSRHTKLCRCSTETKLDRPGGTMPSEDPMKGRGKEASPTTALAKASALFDRSGQIQPRSLPSGGPQARNSDPPGRSVREDESRAQEASSRKTPQTRGPRGAIPPTFCQVNPRLAFLP